ncbi:MAG: hypothetical protein AAF533_29905 [Acidobacteriota bacterium]
MKIIESVVGVSAPSWSMRVLALLLVMLGPGLGSAVAAGAFGGLVVDGVVDSGSCAPASVTGIELYTVKVDSRGLDYTDWLYVKNGDSVGGASQSGFSYVVTGGNFSVAEAGTDRLWFFLTAPSPDTGGDWLATDSTDPSAPNPGATTFQRVGDTIAATFAEHAGTGVRFNGTGLAVPIDLGSGARDFPSRGSGGIDVVFGALIDHQPTHYLPGPDCGFGGGVEHQLLPGRGLIIGYNVYRQDDAGGPAPTKDSWGFEDWLAFIPAVDEPGDLAGTVDLDDVPQNGNEYLFFSDADLSGLRESPQPPPEPGCGRAYWYVIQPVVEGDYQDWTKETRLARVALGFDPRLPGGGIDLTGDGAPEFFSPQAVHAGLPGLGLTVDGRPLVSATVRGCTASDPMATTGHVALRPGADDTLELVLGLESADVLGYDVYRLDRGRRHRVNAMLLPAQGLDGGVVVLDGPRLRARRAGTYEVEILASNGDVRVEGPFTLTAAETRRSRRR